ncbi:MAG: CPBP family intramembrane metalloprotease [Candidatus Nezhaarchaeota archaeon]|nr:CPBP family intramembrane metalloprotease [Candidatus Nezhaarchaeota archaeon]
MSASPLKKITVFVAVTYLVASSIDVMALYGLLPAMVWGFARMWSVAFSTVLCLAIFGERVSSLKPFIGVSIDALRLYLASPLVVYLALGVYVIFALPLGIFDFAVYVKMISEPLAAIGWDVEGLAVALAYAQIALAYLTAITLNAVFALGEEIGWRGYLYRLLSSKSRITTSLIIGLLWGLWHAPATLLLGYNYYFNRLAGVAFFTLFTVLFTYVQLALTDRAKGNVLPASSFHGAVNALWGLAVVATELPREAGELTAGLGATGLASWMVTIIAFHFLAARRWRQEPQATVFRSGGTLRGPKGLEGAS